MLGVYLGTLAFSAVLIGLSFVLGDAEVEADVDVDADLDADLDADVDADADADSSGPSGIDLTWLPFLSLRFWTFAMGAFGLSGTLLTLLSVPSTTVLLLAGFLGMGIGWAAFRVFRWLTRESVSGEVDVRRFIGQEARVLLPVYPDIEGKIVLQTLADRVELVARTRDGSTIERGSQVLIANIEDGVADVTKLL